MKRLTKLFLLCVMISGIVSSSMSPSFAAGKAHPETGKISGRSVGAAALSLFVWPGIGQAVNDNGGSKVLTHAVLGILPPYRFWSSYDALMDRKGGYWKGRI